MSQYTIARDALEQAIASGKEANWSEHEVLQAILVSAIERHVQSEGAKSTRSLLQFEMSNIRGDVDYDFVRSR